MPTRTRIPAGIATAVALLTVAPALAAVRRHVTAAGRQSSVTNARVPRAVGALVRLTSTGRVAGHFCTASVVNSPKGNLVVTAAHCVTGQPAGSFAFVPGYHSHSAPLGVWLVKKAFVDDAWERSSDPDHDFAFLVVKSKSAPSLQALTGAERLRSGTATRKVATVVGFPSSLEAAVTCRNRLLQVSATQLEFDCEGYTTGTSGSALVVDRNPATGLGSVVGVIGGYQQGGTTPAVSYAAAFNATTRTLYTRAMAAG